MITKDYSQKFEEYTMNYKIFLPKEESADFSELPLLVYLHGAGERGTKADHLYRHGIPKLINEGKEINAVVLAPQCPAMYVWDNVVSSAKAIIDKVAAEYKIKKDRIVITGSSMGGFGTWMMGLTYPSFFAAIAPVAGGGMYWRTPKLKTTPVYAFHGEKDDMVPPVYSKLMVDGVNENGGDAKLMILDGLAHNDGIDYAYRNTDLIDWILSKRRDNFDYVPEVCEPDFK